MKIVKNPPERAASEVVIRDSHEAKRIIRQAIDSSIDAGASDIKIYTNKVNREVIIIDDGCGMTNEGLDQVIEYDDTSRSIFCDDSVFFALFSKTRGGAFNGRIKLPTTLCEDQNDALSDDGGLARMPGIARLVTTVLRDRRITDIGAVNKYSIKQYRKSSACQIISIGGGSSTLLEEVLSNYWGGRKFGTILYLDQFGFVDVVDEVIESIGVTNPDSNCTISHNDREQGVSHFFGDAELVEDYDAGKTKSCRASNNALSVLAWNNKFKSLRDVLRDNGGKLPGDGTPEERSLVTWFYNQKEEYKRDRRNKTSKLGVEQRRKMDRVIASLGQTLESHDESWRRQWSLLEGFVKENGRLPTMRDKDAAGSVQWLRNQRQQFRKGKLAKHRIESLKSLTELVSGLGESTPDFDTEIPKTYEQEDLIESILMDPNISYQWNGFGQRLPEQIEDVIELYDEAQREVSEVFKAAIEGVLHSCNPNMYIFVRDTSKEMCLGTLSNELIDLYGDEIFVLGGSPEKTWDTGILKKSPTRTTIILLGEKMEAGLPVSRYIAAFYCSPRSLGHLPPASIWALKKEVKPSRFLESASESLDQESWNGTLRGPGGLRIFTMAKSRKDLVSYFYLLGCSESDLKIDPEPFVNKSLVCAIGIWSQLLREIFRDRRLSNKLTLEEATGYVKLNKAFMEKFGREEAFREGRYAAHKMWSSDVQIAAKAGRKQSNYKDDILGKDGALYFPLHIAKRVLKPLGLKSLKEYRKAASEGRLPEAVPPRPSDYYKKLGWSSWACFLGEETEC